MNRSSLRYKLYKHSIEKNFTHAQRDMILSESFLSKIGAFFGLPSEVSGAVGKAFKNAEVTAVTKSLKKNFEELQSLANKVEGGEDIIPGIINSLLTASGFDASKISQADLTKISEEEKTSSGGDSQLKPGQPAKASLSDASSQPAAASAGGALAVSMLASAAGQDPEKAIGLAQEKDVPFQKAYKNLINKVAEESDEDVDTVKKILDWLFDNERIIPQTKISFGESLKRNKNVLYERWGRLSGIINEENPVDSKTAPETDSKTGNDEGSGEYAKLANFISKQIKISVKLILPVLDALVKKCGVKLAK